MGIVEEAHNVKILGSGERVILLAHGFGSDQSVWRYLVPYLVQDYKVILYDNMGAGTTNPEYFDFERYSSVDGYVYDLLAILEELQVQSCIFIGHSYSGMIGAMASIHRPDFFSKIIMLSSTPRLLNDTNYTGGFEEKQINQIFEGMQSNYKSWCEGLAPMVVGGDMDSPAIQEYSRTLFNVRPDIALCVAHVKFHLDVRHILPLVKKPCHILQSTSETVPVYVSEYLRRNLGGPTVVELMPTSGHLLQLSAPNVIIPVILKHIRLDITKK